MKSTIELIKSLSLPDFPSGSSINFHRGKLYLIGDDAKDMLVMDSDYEHLSIVHLFDDPLKRIPKHLKHDFETSAVVSVGGEDYLIVLGSGSRSNRTKGLLIPLEDGVPVSTQIKTINYQEFIKRLEAYQLGEINIEGCTLIGDHIVLNNRANSKNLVNKLIVTNFNFWNDQKNANIFVSTIKLPTKQEEIIGVSELCYAPSSDILFMTLSTEGTDNAYEDGAIGDSYVGWIDRMTSKIKSPEIELNGLINLSNCDDIFKGEKIEGLSIENEFDKGFIIHLVSDDDKGHSKLFKIRLSF